MNEERDGWGELELMHSRMLPYSYSPPPSRLLIDRPIAPPDIRALAVVGVTIIVDGAPAVVEQKRRNAITKVAQSTVPITRRGRALVALVRSEGDERDTCLTDSW